jgi:hypothetical protein
MRCLINTSLQRGVSDAAQAESLERFSTANENRSSGSKAFRLALITQLKQGVNETVQRRCGV